MSGVWPLHRMVPVALALILGAQELFAGYRRRPDADLQDRGSLYLVWALIGIGYWVAFGLWRGGAPPGPALGEASMWIGAVLALGGMALRVWSVATLGRYFTFAVRVTGDQPVIEAGPYRLIRHPSYAGALLTAMGIGLSLRYVLAPLIIALPAFAGFAVRMSVEERALADGIGPAYRAYMARTKRIMPFLY